MKKVIVILLACFLAVPGSAQRKTAKGRVTEVAPQKGKATTTARDSRKNEHVLPKELLASTAKLMFVDSIVVEKDEFYKYIPLPSEIGKFIPTIPSAPASLVGNAFVNGLDKQCFYAAGDTTSASLFSMDRLTAGWAQPQKVEDVDNGFDLVGFPYQLSDGMTLFFSAKDKRTLGGYDIFMTRYDPEKGSYLTPENYGLPFNSTDNDYLLAIDEPDSLGWLVTDRRQPEGKVCIYTFVPTKGRKTYEADNLTEAQLYNFAIIHRIADTWKLGDRQAALDRLRRLKQPKSAEPLKHSLAANDHIDHVEGKGLKRPENVKRLEEYRTGVLQLAEMRRQLDRLRKQYKSDDGATKASAKGKITTLENGYIKLSGRLKHIRKSIINTENSQINN